MALNLNRRGGGTSSPGGPSPAPVTDKNSERRSSQRPAQVSETYGRFHAPPPPGSSYWDFEFWATQGGAALPEDIDLAIKLWSAAAPDPEDEPGPSPR